MISNFVGKLNIIASATERFTLFTFRYEEVFYEDLTTISFDHGKIVRYKEVFTTNHVRYRIAPLEI